MSTITYEHIEIRADGVPYVVGTQTKVIEIALDRIAHHWDADEMHRQHPYLSLGQIHAALAYYFDHQEQLDADIDRRRAFVERMRAEAAPSVVREKLERQS